MLRTLAFGDLETGIWGVIWDLGDAGFALLGDGVSGEAAPANANIEGSGSDHDWRVSGEAVSIEASPDGSPGDVDGGFEQLIRVRGWFVADGSERTGDCLGRRGVREEFDPDRFEAIRDVSAWFEPALGMAVVAARPRGANGHGDDLLSAAVLEDGHALRVTEPRLSTTYGESGMPTRASLELWLAHPAPPEGDEAPRDGDDHVERFPRRAAGESLGAHGTAVAGSVDAYAELFRWHARGREGAGVYVLARPARA